MKNIKVMQCSLSFQNLYNASFAPGFTNKELKDEISRQRKNTRFKHQSEQFWVAQKTKGRGAVGAPPPFVFCCSHFFELLLKSCICSLTADLIFQFFVGEAWGERRIILWKYKEHQNYDLCL